MIDKLISEVAALRVEVQELKQRVNQLDGSQKRLPKDALEALKSALSQKIIAEGLEGLHKWRLSADEPWLSKLQEGKRVLNSIRSSTLVINCLILTLKLHLKQ